MWITAAPTEPLSRVLDAVEDASPLEAVEAVTSALAGALGAEAAAPGRCIRARPPGA
jgi:hypothetical protein